jgi:hypothetical protein
MSSYHLALRNWQPRYVGKKRCNVKFMPFPLFADPTTHLFLGRREKVRKLLAYTYIWRDHHSYRSPARIVYDADIVINDGGSGRECWSLSPSKQVALMNLLLLTAYELTILCITSFFAVQYAPVAIMSRQMLRANSAYISHWVEGLTPRNCDMCTRVLPRCPEALEFGVWHPEMPLQPENHHAYEYVRVRLIQHLSKSTTVEVLDRKRCT